jgi:chemotaxis protein methyltransferase CheR
MTVHLDRNELSLWIRLVYELTGIALNEEKEYLIRERLQGLLEKYRCSSFSHLYFLAREVGRKDLHEDLIDHITTKETSFFRDTSPFEALRTQVFPELFRQCRSLREKRPLRIWSTACSTGQEAYSLAMLLQEMGISPRDYRITATDISRQALETAKLGRYNRFEVERGVSSHLLKRFFTACSEHWEVNESLKDSVDFQRLSLHRPFMLAERFDLIVCRNVAIYFSPDHRRNLFRQINRQLHSEGYLLIGVTESVSDLAPLFREERLNPGVTFHRRGKGDAESVSPQV